MNLKLYIYEHCPFCVKARMIFGLKDLPFDQIILQHNDETQPIRMTGYKLVPILEEEGRFMGESMDIVAYIDQNKGTPLLTGASNPAIMRAMHSFSGIYSLLYPRAAMAPLPEFATQAARRYFIRRKEGEVGNFARCMKETPNLIKRYEESLEKLEPLIQSPDAVNGRLSNDDIHLFAQLRSLSIVKGIHYPAKVDAYRRRMAQLTGIFLFDAVAN
ncbi:MAG: glutaredoxin 2 [Zymomonas mobilis subsp. pomaceae]|uniref:Glutaredoxin, GrxB family n=1 Tax=Zymomonas mobilis subsp. pomaceae (strain ATCC 29192 / DSM 22645 / JCM 10191 / CCUG 17912 / NBRC 13757 / NCIMB 11200 / NRRL B-4491 / Barker I) TaxID=579138 RepID=F8ETG8_ZYMMT|nr:glutaredoxin 2 [Zymomonas mobilis]AEI37993.1 glutaredoxin, GrxB family [Zymomonas mobilis subsp. pomaceae ATCC 29192]MDX5949361.1 glutaredoxin 2 [Zymomonas mobilis subsp. pomaceae]GEB89907.1 glutaredoxin 2 [Zymomonas mobilis subsp. pomaceae]